MKLDSEQQARARAGGFPVTTMTQRDQEGVHYLVIAGDVDGDGRTVWDEHVEFTKKHRAGSTLFVAAARMQEKMAEAVLEFLTKEGS